MAAEFSRHFLLHCSLGIAGHHIFLENQKQNYHRQNRDRLPGKSIFQLCKTYCKYAAHFIFGNNFGPKISIPPICKGNERHGKDCRFAHRYQHMCDAAQPS